MNYCQKSWTPGPIILNRVGNIYTKSSSQNLLVEDRVFLSKLHMSLSVVIFNLKELKEVDNCH